MLARIKSALNGVDATHYSGWKNKLEKGWDCRAEEYMEILIWMHCNKAWNIKLELHLKTTLKSFLWKMYE